MSMTGFSRVEGFDLKFDRDRDSAGTANLSTIDLAAFTVNQVVLLGSN